MKRGLWIFFFAIVASAQTPSGNAILSLNATTENIARKNEPIRIHLFRWSSSAERDQVVAAWNLTPAPAAQGARRGRGAAPTTDPGDSDSTVTTPAARGNRGAAARGGGAARGRGGNAAPAVTPEVSLTTALGKLPTVGHLWSSEVAGYAIRYAARFPQPDGSERIVLVTDRRLGAWSDSWKPVGSENPAAYEFSLIEIHLNSKGLGEGKASLTGKISVDAAASTLALENYAAQAVILANVTRQ